MTIGCAMYLYEVTLDPATLPPDVRAMTEAIPEWSGRAFALSVWVGLPARSGCCSAAAWPFR